MKGEKTGIWINNTFYSPIKETGAILIPYTIDGYRNTLILKYNDFCCLETGINIPEESYELKGQFIINEESFIMGNITKIIARLYLYVCDELCPLEYLKNIKLIINTVKTENNQEIPSMNVIDNIQLSYDKEFCFDFQVPAKLKKVDFTISGEIEYKTNKKKETLTLTKGYEFTSIKDYDTLLKIDFKGNNLIYFLGKNGEPKSNYQINLKLWDKNERDINDNGFLLETDSEGKINLGKLNDIGGYSINDKVIKNGEIKKHVFFKNMNILENEEICLHFDASRNKNITLFKLINGKYSENISQLIKLEITDNIYNLGKIKLPKLLKGQYQLNIYDDICITINVLKGEIMKINEFIILENGSIIYNNSMEPFIAIENVTYNNNELKIKLNKNNKSQSNPRVHISFSHYLSKKTNLNLYEFMRSGLYQYRSANNQKEFKFNENKNIYLNNKILSE